jgi:hypothetical protein
MNFRNRNTYDVIEKFRRFRSIYDKVFIAFTGSLWIFSTLWDIYQLQRYWLDYAVEFYTSFLIFCMIIYSISPKYLSKRIYNSFRIITTIKGRGALLIIISSLFISDKHDFHKFCAVLFLLGGIFYFICEILVPTTQDELDKIEIIYNPQINEKNDQSSQIKISNISINTQISTEANKKTISNQINVNRNQNEANENEISNNNSINITQTILIDETNGKNNNLNNQENTGNNNAFVYENEIVRKTDNPYEIPEDF